MALSINSDQIDMNATAAPDAVADLGRVRSAPSADPYVSGPCDSLGSSGVRQQCSSHSAAATSAAAHTAPIDAVMVSDAAEASSERNGST
jgi:hypothetical protein